MKEAPADIKEAPVKEEDAVIGTGDSGITEAAEVWMDNAILRKLLTPADVVKPLYLQYVKLEEDYGLAKHAMKVYDQDVKVVPNSEKLAMYEVYIARVAEIFGIPKTREIYEQAIESGLPNNDVKTMCMKYTELERSLGEIDRVHVIYVFASQFADPRSDPGLWEKWKYFEVQHGNEDTFREMLRISHNVSADYSQTHFILPEYLMQKDQKLNLEEVVDTLKRARVYEDEMVALERQLSPVPASVAVNNSGRMVDFVSTGEEAKPNDGRKVAVANNEDIDLPEESDSDDEKVEIAMKDVPAAVYGELASQAMKENDASAAEDGGSDSRLGALERLKKQQKHE